MARIRLKKLIFRRPAAYFVDIGLLAVVFTPFGFLLSLAYGHLRGPQLWEILVACGSIPAWIYFILRDRRDDGATIGKKIFKIQVRAVSGRHLTTQKAAFRTLFKMLPWELAILFVFKLESPDRFWSRLQTVGVTLTGLLILAYAVTTLMTRGERCLYDNFGETRVRESKKPIPGAASPQRRGSRVLLAGRPKKGRPG